MNCWNLATFFAPLHTFTLSSFPNIAALFCRSETLDCSKQNTRLTVTMKVTSSMVAGSTEYSLANGSLLVVCEGRSLFVSMPPSVPYDALSGKHVTVQVGGISDLLGNTQVCRMIFFQKKKIPKLLASTAVFTFLLFFARRKP